MNKVDECYVESPRIRVRDKFRGIYWPDRQGDLASGENNWRRICNGVPLNGGISSLVL